MTKLFEPFLSFVLNTLLIKQSKASCTPFPVFADVSKQGRLLFFANSWHSSEEIVLASSKSILLAIKINGKDLTSWKELTFAIQFWRSVNVFVILDCFVN